jgi:hypothetical protein
VIHATRPSSSPMTTPWNLRSNDPGIVEPVYKKYVNRPVRVGHQRTWCETSP